MPQARSEPPQLVVHQPGKAVGRCAFCDREIVAPTDVAMWVDDETYHRDCYQYHLARLATDQGIRRAI